MANFHSSDGWFVWGIVTIVLYLAVFSGWNRLQHPLYSSVWSIFSLTQVVSAIFSIILHSKLSNLPLLLATALWNLLSLVVLVWAIARTYQRLIDMLEVKQQRRLRFHSWMQHIVWIAVPFFASSTACWVHSDSVASRRVYFRNVGRALNWAGGALLMLCFLCSIAVGIVLSVWSSSKTKVPCPIPAVTFGMLLSVPFVLVRFAVQIYWMRFRNSSGATFGLYIGCGAVPNLIISTINLLFAWYTYSTISPAVLLKSHEVFARKAQRDKATGYKGAKDSVTHENAARRRGSFMSTIWAASVSTIASVSRMASYIGDRKTNRPFSSEFTIKATGHVYRMDNGSILIRSARRVHKSLHTRADCDFEQAPFHLNPITVRVDSQRVVAQIARLLWLFTLWDGCEEKDSDQQRAIEVDILSIWYEEIKADSGRETPFVHAMRSFREIKDAVLGSQQRRPEDKMLERVYLHFFCKMEEHSTDTRASACLFALRLMLRKELHQAQSIEPTHVEASEGSVLDIDEDMWKKFNNLAAGKEAI